MATTPTPANATLATEATTLVSQLQTHTLNISLLNLAVLVLVLAGFGFIYYHSSMQWQKMMAEAQTREQTFEATLQKSDDQWKQDQATIAQLQAQQAKTQTVIVDRDQATDKQIQTVTAPDRTAQQVSSDVQSVFGFPPINMDNQLFSFSQPEVQQFVSTKVDDTRANADLKDEQSVVADQKQQLQTVQKDNTSCQTDLKQAQGVIAAYKKVAKKSKWHMVLDKTKEYGLAVAAFYIGRKI